MVGNILRLKVRILNIEKIKGMEIEVSEEVLDALKLATGEVNEQFIELMAIFKDDFSKIFPIDKEKRKIIIESTVILDSLIKLNKNLNILKNCQGFKKHVEKYHDENAFRHNYLVTSLAGFLFHKVDNVELEPIVQHHEKRSGKISEKSPDIKIEMEGIDIYIEHESIDTEKFNYLDEHRNCAESIIKNLKEIPYQMEIIHKRPFVKTNENKIENDRMRDLCKIINDKLPSVINEGVIINNDTFKVHVVKKSEESKNQMSNIRSIREIGKDKFYLRMNEYERLIVYGSKKDDIEDKEFHKYCFFLALCDTAEHYIYSSHTFFLSKSIIIIAGPENIDFKPVLYEKIKRARSQSPIDKAYVLVINEEEMLGSIKENREILENIFQSRKNSRFSGILLVKNDIKGLDFDFIQNPYGKQISDKFQKIKIADKRC